MAFKPIKLSDVTTYVSCKDPAVDRDRVIERELEENPDNKELSEQEINPETKRELAWRLFSEMTFPSKVGERPAASLDLLPIKDGESPTKFIIGAIPPGEMNRVVDDTSETARHKGKSNERFWRCFCHGVRDIQGWPGDVKKRTINGIDTIEPEWLAANFVGGLREVALEVGMVVYRFNSFTEDEVKN